MKSGDVTAEELAVHRAHVTDLKTKVLKHVREEDGVFTRWKVARVEKMFNTTFGLIDQRAWKILEQRRPSPSKKEIQLACSLLSPEAINGVNKNGDSPLHLLLQLDDNPEALEILLKKGADPLIQNKEGMTPLHLAVGYGKFETGQALVDKIVQTGGAASFPFANHAGNNPFHILATKDTKGTELTAWLKTFEPITEAQQLQPFLLKNRAGQTPIHLAMHRPTASRFEVANETQTQYGLTHDVNMGMIGFLFNALSDSPTPPEPTTDELAKAFKKEGSPLHYAVDLLAEENNPVEEKESFERCILSR